MRKQVAAETGKLGQIWDIKPIKGQMGIPGEMWFFQDTSLKIGTVPENPGRMDGHLKQISIGNNDTEAKWQRNAQQRRPNVSRLDQP